MLGRLRRMLTGESQDSDTHDKLQVATCALLLEVAYADHSLDGREAELIREHLRERFDLASEKIDSLLDEARDARRGSSDLFQFAREINAACSLEEKLSVLETLWRVIYADGVLDKYEDALARQLAGLLRISPRTAIDLKLKVLHQGRDEG